MGEGVINVDSDGGGGGGGGVLTSGAIPDDNGDLFRCDVVDGDDSSQLRTRAVNIERTYVQARLLK